MIDDEVYCKLKNQYQNLTEHRSEEQHTWSDEIKELFNPKITTLFSHEFPDKVDFKIGEYIAFLDIVYSGDMLMLKDMFRWSNAYLWLVNILQEHGGCLFFGAITEELHNALVSDPKPYRKDVKQLLANLLSMVEELQMDEIMIDKSNFSQRVRLR